MLRCLASGNDADVLADVQRGEKGRPHDPPDAGKNRPGTRTAAGRHRDRGWRESRSIDQTFQAPRSQLPGEGPSTVPAHAAVGYLANGGEREAAGSDRFFRLRRVGEGPKRQNGEVYPAASLAIYGICPHYGRERVLGGGAQLREGRS